MSRFFAFKDATVTCARAVTWQLAKAGQEQDRFKSSFHASGGTSIRIGGLKETATLAGVLRGSLVALLPI
jgi:hypothetical protein